MPQLAQDIGLLELAANVFLSILSLDLVKVDQLANQLFSSLNIFCQTDDAFRPMAEAMISNAILAGKQLQSLVRKPESKLSS